MERWEIEGQQDSAWNGMGSYANLKSRKQKKGRKGKERDEQWSTTGTNGSSKV